MNASTHTTPFTSSADPDLAQQAHEGHGIPSQDPETSAQFPLSSEEAKRETNSVMVGGGVIAGAVTGAAIGGAVVGPVGVVIGATLGAGAGALGGAVAGAASQDELHLKTFVLEKEMRTMSGAFYPTGYVVVMFPHGQQAEQVAHELVSSGFDGEAIMLLRPETVLREIGHVEEGIDLLDLPSVGTEEATMQQYIHLARQGHHGLMVHAASDKDTEHVMLAVRGQPFSFAQKYHMLAMEDLK
jgi:hypothetical protein